MSKKKINKNNSFARGPKRTWPLERISQVPVSKTSRGLRLVYVAEKVMNNINKHNNNKNTDTFHGEQMRYCTPRL